MSTINQISSQNQYQDQQNINTPTVVILSITQLQRAQYKDNLDNSTTPGNSNNSYDQYKDEPILCYVYLGEKIQDVRGICRDETRIKLVNPNRDNLVTNVPQVKEEVIQKQILIQVKQGSSYTLGYIKIPLKLLSQIDLNNRIKTWFPLFKNKDHTPLTYDELTRGNQYNDNYDQIYVDLRLENEIPSTQRSPQRNPFKDGSDRQNLSQNSYSNNSGIYQEISDNITLISGQPFQESQKIVIQSLGQQIFKKKKKTYTQSALPQIQLIPQNTSQNNTSINKSGAQSLLTPQDIEISLISEHLLQQLPSTIDKTQIKNDLTVLIDTQVVSIQDKSTQKFKEVTNLHQKVHDISQSNSKDIIVNDQRQTLLNNLTRNTNALVNNRKDQENQKQQLLAQIKLQEVHGGHQQKREKLEQLQAEVQQLKNDMQNIQEQPMENIYESTTVAQSQTTDANSKETDTIQNQLYYLQQELLLLVTLAKQKTLQKTVQDVVYEEADKTKDFIVSSQSEYSSQYTVLQIEQNQINQDYMKLQSEIQGAKYQQIYNQQIIERQNLEISYLQKQIQAEQESLQCYNSKLDSLIISQKYQLQNNTQELTLLSNTYKMSQSELQNLQTLLSQEQQKHKDLLLQQQQDPSCLQSSSDVQQQTQQIQDALQDLRQVLDNNKQAMLQLRDIGNSCDTTVSSECIEQIIGKREQISDDGGRYGYMKQIISDKNELINTKDIKYNEIQFNIESIKHQLEYLNQKQSLYSEFSKKLDILSQYDDDLKTELLKIEKIDKNFAKILEESLEKLDIQQNDFQQFELDIKQQAQDFKDQRAKEQQKLDQLLGIKTKQELDDYLRLKLSEIREMEANLRGKDHEVDTLELIQSQKDSIILELEEQAGRFKEVIKEVHYESQKNDRVEVALIRYLQVHPCGLEMRKLGDGYYKFGTRRIYLKLDANDQSTLLVRIAPKEYITLSMFIIENEGIEMQKIGIGKALQQRFH